MRPLETSMAPENGVSSKSLVKIQDREFCNYFGSLRKFPCVSCFPLALHGGKGREMSFRFRAREWKLSPDKLRLRNGFWRRIAERFVLAGVRRAAGWASGRAVRTCSRNVAPALVRAFCLAGRVGRRNGFAFLALPHGFEAGVSRPGDCPRGCSGRLAFGCQKQARVSWRSRSACPCGEAAAPLYACGNRPPAVRRGVAPGGAARRIWNSRIPAPDRRSGRNRPQDSRLWRLNAPFR